MGLMIFDEISKEEMLSIFSEGRKRNLKKDEFLFHQGDETDSLHLLIEGKLQIFKYDSGSNEVTLNFFSPVSMIAELALINGIPFPASGRFVTDGAVLSLPFKELRERIKTDIPLNHLLIQSLFSKIQALNLSINRGMTMDSLQRVAHFLYYLPEGQATLAHSQIASMLALRPETFSRALKQLKDQGIINPERGLIEVLKKEELKKFF
ncbi:Crp/Fnr family transcriptional regulator [Leptospira licerasiae]|uniref:Cyclic nucleotide-binding domain protein n=1 Tax=Leptospira licerasiae str. MMD4847 TaxID=1049971 RepID=A0ABP2RCE9_9LEPT|nr:Crp/Fnr family transcriptional regulator [Leptospira licerasiae]EIE02922.1 cyclic nucleotide-binding domain / transcriptional regulator, Crp/Fnr family multi-domain protein [Leptospira licerasiae serovar Varillal str. VAR 010]EJZ40871.1 cyclic nucleotide-binding domain protein [Leptospira licerasiae str. MMD4847]